MELKYSFKMKDNRIFPIISVRESSNDNYVDIDKYKFNLIVKMFDSWEDWWKEAKKATYKPDVVDSKSVLGEVIKENSL
ncbi:hypothetical protein KAW18_03860 [candidate division WOR-3 bacterium]|nr:hypothetical protein [candidate division WOR-3 bacterium]